MNSAAKDYDGFNKYIRITDISETSNKFIPNPLTSPDGNLEDKYKLKKGDIVFARTGASTGKTYLYDENDGNLYFAGFLIKFHINNANPKFIFYNTLKDEYLNWVSVMSVRSGQPGINSNEYKKLPLNLPSLEEQKKISNFLTSIDKKIELLENKHKYYQDFKRYLMQQIFAQKLRFDFKDEWKIVQLKDIAFVPKKTKLTNIDGLKLLTVKLHTKGIEINDKIKPKLTKRGRPYYIREYGELLIGRQNFHNGGMGIVPKSLDGGICSNAISSFRVFEDKIDINYLYYFLARPEYYIKSERLIGGTGQKEFSEKELLKLKIELPSIEEQSKIVDLLRTMDNKINICEIQLNRTQEFKKGLLQQMFV